MKFDLFILVLLWLYIVVLVWLCNVKCYIMFLYMVKLYLSFEIFFILSVKRMV